MFCLAVAGVAMALAQARAACFVPPGTWTPSATATARPQVLVVGDYHMANPDLDIADSHAGNVLSPKRQTQIKQVAAVLARFKPTKVAVEQVPGKNAALASKYAQYVAGKRKLDRNEIQQLGFRVAKKLGLKTVCGVDNRPGLNMGKYKQFAKAAGLSNEYNALVKNLKKQAKAGTAYLATHTVRQYLIRLNSNSRVAWNVGLYYRSAHLGRPGHYEPADLTAKWFDRNMRIYTNVVHLIGSDHARILVLMGAGHLGWLRRDFAGDPTIRLRKLSEFAQ
jgi:hypothetical protein